MRGVFWLLSVRIGTLKKINTVYCKTTMRRNAIKVYVANTKAMHMILSNVGIVG